MSRQFTKRDQATPCNKPRLRSLKLREAKQSVIGGLAAAKQKKVAKKRTNRKIQEEKNNIKVYEWVYFWLWLKLNFKYFSDVDLGKRQGCHSLKHF